MKPKWMAFLPFSSLSYSLWVWQTFLPPKFQNCSQIKCVYVFEWGWCWGRSDMYCVFRKGYDTLFIIFQEFSCSFILFCEANEKFRCLLLFLGLLFSFDTWEDPGKKKLAWNKDAEDCCPLDTLKLMEDLLWAQHLESSRTELLLSPSRLLDF